MKKIFAILAASFMFMALIATPAGAVSPVVVGFSYVGADVATYGVTGFSIERKTEACLGTVNAWAVIGTTGNIPRTFTDATVAGATTYCYRVKAVNAAGSSPASGVAEKTTVADLPPAPSGVTAT